MKKLITICITMLLCVGCACSADKASDTVKEYLTKYNNKDEQILVELEKLMEEEKLTDEQKELYRDIMEKQYEDLKYEIQEEKYNGEEATVTTKITVYDLYTIQKEADEYKNNHQEEFLDKNKKYDANKFLNYKLDLMKKTSKRIDYTIDFKVIKKEESWTLDKVKTEDLEKIHGIYNETNS